MSYKIHFSEEMIQRLIQLVVSHTGLQIREQDRKSFCQKIETRINYHRLFSPEQYYQLLSADTEESHQEWRQLMLLLTTLETYFFRDQGQFSLLKNHLLPQLIEQKRQAAYISGESKPSLRIWSAGCSTGEEPYSLAILLQEMIINWENWNIFILGTDINLEAIEKAKEGFYSSWSFRMVNTDIHKKYFQQIKDGYLIAKTIREKVRFQQGNLVKDTFPRHADNIYNMDLIICRNVFVYFDNPSIGMVLEKFSKTLNSQGYLLTGHAELYGQNLNCLKSQMFPDSIVYQRQESQVKAPPLEEHSLLPPSSILNPKKLARSTGKPTTNPQSFISHKAKHSSPNTSASHATNKTLHRVHPKEEASTSPSETLLKEAKLLFLKKSYNEAIKLANNLLELHPKNFDLYYFIAQIYANLGNYQQAYDYAQQALKINSFADSPYHLLAHIAEEQGNMEAAKDFLKTVIYLTPDSISAYLELGSLYEKAGDTLRAQKMRVVALDLLKKLPHNATVKQQGGLTAKELILQVKKLLQT